MENRGSVLRTALSLVCGLAGFGCVGATARAADAPPPGVVPPLRLTPVTLDATVSLKGYHDPWLAARERWWDIVGNPYNAFLDGTQRFSYFPVPDAGGVPVQVPTVTLSYCKAPPVPYFIGHLEAHGLKPNFSYQIKLVGKPQKGARGWGAEGDDEGNERLGYAGRWFCGHPMHASGTNFDDNHYREYYKNALPGAEHNIYAYILAGEWVTDGNGDLSADFTTDNAYHIAWQWWQNASKDVFAKKVRVQSASWRGTNSLYGYGANARPNSVTMYYENQPDRQSPITLPPGSYNCFLLLTEESFHNPVAAIPEGGYWKSVMATEDFLYNRDGNVIGHDMDPSNDVRFTIGADPAVTAMHAALTVVATRKSEHELQATAYVTVTDRIGHRIRNVAVTGDWTGVHNELKVQSNSQSTGTATDGVARFDTPTVTVRRRGCFTFKVTNLERKGRTWDKDPRLSASACL